MKRVITSNENAIDFGHVKDVISRVESELSNLQFDIKSADRILANKLSKEFNSIFESTGIIEYTIKEKQVKQ